MIRECGLGEEESELRVWMRWRKVIWEGGLGGGESDLGVWIRWRGK